MSSKNYFRVLGIGLDAEDVVIQAAYRAMMRRYHPDMNGDPDAQLQALKINEAYEVLKDPGRRRQHREEILRNHRERTANRRSHSDNNASDTKKRSTPKSQSKPEASVRVSTDDSSVKSLAWGFTGFVGLILLIAALSSKPTSRDPIIEATQPTEIAPVVVAQTGSVKLSDQGTPEIDFGTIENAAKSFASTLDNKGIMAARRFSEQCHKEVAANPSWMSADRCAAFDFAAAHIDEKVSRDGDWPVDAYFAFQKENQQRHYVSAGAEYFSLIPRLTQIRENAARVVDEAMLVIRQANARKELENARSKIDEDENTSASTPSDGSSGIQSNADDSRDLESASNAINNRLD